MSSCLWVGNFTAGIFDLDLKNVFEKRGGMDDITCFLLRNHAFVYLKNAEDAKKAKDNLQGVVFLGNRLKIDFAKPAKPCKCLWISGISTTKRENLEEEFSKFGKIEDFKFQPDKNCAIIDYYKLQDAITALKAMHGKKIGRTLIRVDYSRSHHKNFIQPSESLKWNKELPSNILCISYPPAVYIDEQMLYNALILFGEIENIKSFPSRYCSLVEFRSMEEALRAKNGFQGKLFNDPRILITFSRNEHAPSPYFTGPRGPIAPNSFHMREIPRGVGGHFSPMRPFAHRDSNFGGTDPGFSISIGDPLTKSTLGTWDAFDESQAQRDPKRLRTDGYMRVGEMNNSVMLNDQIFRGVPHVGSGAPSNTRFTGPNTRFTGPNIVRADVEYMWRGVLAKGGTPVCRARCVPIGDWIGYEMPEIVNCSARTGLDTLAKHYADAIGFDIIYFLPDSEEDFASYTEFLQYMGDRNRAGVVKFPDGTTLFLVPPSDFLKTVLKVSGPARLYGVVLKFPPRASDNLSCANINPPHVNHVPPVTATSATPVGLSLTPELVATLASLTKVNYNGQQPSDNTVPGTRQLYEHEAYNLNGEFMQSDKVNDQQHQVDHAHDLHAAGNVVTSSSQVYDTNVYESQSIVPGQQNVEFEADKSKRYQSTLQFAANLLLQIQQKRLGTETNSNH